MQKPPRPRGCLEGQNGSGKTSLSSAIIWALTGSPTLFRRRKATQPSTISQGLAARRGRRTWHVSKLLGREPGDPRSGHSRMRWSALGRRGAEANDARTWEVRLRHSSEEADEQSRATGRGAGGARSGNRGECRPAKHVPGTEPGKRATGAGTHTARRLARDGALLPSSPCSVAGRYSPEVGAECPNWARSDLCGGRSAMSGPTAIFDVQSENSSL